MSLSALALRAGHAAAAAPPAVGPASGAPRGPRVNAAQVLSQSALSAHTRSHPASLALRQTRACRHVASPSSLSFAAALHGASPLPLAGLARAPPHAQRPRLLSVPSASGEGATSTTEEDSGKKTEESAPGSGSAAGDGASAEAGNGAAAQEKPLPLGDLEYQPLQGWGKFTAQFKMLFAPIWARVKKGSVLTLRLGGRISEQQASFGSSSVALPKLLENLQKAAVDPRVSALAVRIDPLSVGWGKMEEIRRHILLFRKSGKPTVAYMQVVGEMEYYLASAFEEIYVPPSAYVSLRGLAVQGAFLGGVLEKAGVEAQVQRIGKYKSAGDQFARKDMSEAQREMLGALLDDIYFNWIGGISAARGRTVDEIQALLDGGVITAQQLLDQGLVTGLLYEREVEALLKARTGQDNADKPLLKVDYRKYSRVTKWTLNLHGGKDAMIAILRAAGPISQGKDRGMGGQVRSDSFIEKIRFVKNAKQFKAVVLRVDSPGGDALASDLMWDELRELAKEKPLVASMADVAASGGYYMAMAAPVIVAEHLTLTGSIGVVLAKFNLKDLYGRIGFNREILSKGKFAEINADNRSFTPEEEKFFAAGAENAYESFRNKAAMSRSLPVEKMEAVAQGRVWTGNQALQRGLIDAVGGISRALAIAKDRAGIPADKQVRTVEFSVMGPSITALLSGASLWAQLLGLQGEPAQRSAIAGLVFHALGAGASLDESSSALVQAPPGSVHALMPDVKVVGMCQPEMGAWGGMAGESELWEGSQQHQPTQLLMLLRGLLQ